MTGPLILIFGEDEKEIQTFAETLRVADPGIRVGNRFVNQLLPNHIEECEKVYMLQDYPSVREAYGEKAVLADAKTGTEIGTIKRSEKGSKQ